MSFTKKRIKLSVFEMPNDAVIETERIRANAACRLDDLPLENGAQNIGWVAGKSELDIDMPDVWLGDLLRNFNQQWNDDLAGYIDRKNDWLEDYCA